MGGTNLCRQGTIDGAQIAQDARLHGWVREPVHEERSKLHVSQLEPPPAPLLVTKWISVSFLIMANSKRETDDSTVKVTGNFMVKVTETKFHGRTEQGGTASALYLQHGASLTLRSFCQSSDPFGVSSDLVAAVIGLIALGQIARSNSHLRLLPSTAHVMDQDSKLQLRWLYSEFIPTLAWEHSS